jgi:hypothetical protein
VLGIVEHTGAIPAIGCLECHQFHDHGHPSGSLIAVSSV